MNKIFVFDISTAVFVLFSIQITVTSANFGSESTCSAENAVAIWTGMPACQPRETIVEVPQLLDAELFQVVPKFVSVPRCSGTCHQGNQYHNCIPTRTKMERKSVMIQRYNETGHLYSNCAEVSVESHESCMCGCKITEADCQANQRFSPNLCRCECTNRDEMSACYASDAGLRGLKMWDSQNCRCRCTESFKECSTGYIYDQTDTCSCVRNAELRPASSVPVVALTVALVGTLTCLFLVLFNYNRTKKVLANMKRHNEVCRVLSTDSTVSHNLNVPKPYDRQISSKSAPLLGSNAGSVSAPQFTTENESDVSSSPIIKGYQKVNTKTVQIRSPDEEEKTDDEGPDKTVESGSKSEPTFSVGNQS